ncbi:MAG: hypothetical protein KDE53_40650, partial [Caldilineaceae bacterium]|nr:hypothetical protein [Caldilineaceae bacterium]
SFVKHFYASYFQDRSVQRAFDNASLHILTGEKSDFVKPQLIQRAKHNSEGKLMVEATMTIFPDVMYIDLSSVEELLDSLDMPREQVLNLIARKIKIHAWIFAVPRDNAILSIGETLLGEFSWNAAANFITCNRLYRVKEDVDPKHWGLWSRLLLLYNDLCGETYRSPFTPSASPSRKEVIDKGLRRMNKVHADIAHDIEALIQMGFTKVGLSYSLATSYLELANEKFKESDLPMTVAYLESTLSSLHDAINSSSPSMVP